MNFLPQTTIRLVSRSQTRESDWRTEEEMEISHLTQSSAAPSLVAALTVMFQCTLTSQAAHMLSLQSGKEQYLTGDMWQCRYAP